jgi:hypothetical protein
MNHAIRRLGGLLVLLSALALGQPANDTILLDDDFGALPPRMFSSGVVGAQAEYHFLPAVAQQGNWQVSSFRSEGSQRAWRVIVENDEHVMWQAFTNEERDLPYNHPTLVAGDPLWTDYTFTVDFAPDSKTAPSGVIFRYQNDRCYYFFGVKGEAAVLMRVSHGNAFRTTDIRILGQTPLKSPPGRYISAAVTVAGDKITASLDGIAVIEATDPTYAAGGIGLMADIPTRYRRVIVKTTPETATAIHAAIAARESKERELQTTNPKMVLWKKIETAGFGTSRQVRFGDLNNDGQVDVLICQIMRHGPKDRNCEVGCLTAMTLDGQQLWQIGEPDPWNDLLTNDVAVQIHDVDGDGKTEVVYAKDFKLIVADGATGQPIRSIDTPENKTKRKPFDKFPRILGDAIFFADLRGTGHDSDILIKDRYEQFWLFTDKLEPLWSGVCNTGHFPFAADIDGDGKDELAIGYSLYKPDGSLLWSLDDRIQDHCDGVAIVDFDQDPATPPTFLNAASDEGMIFLDAAGAICAHHQIGHAQNPAVANFRDDLPGLESVVVNFWGNQGIVTFYDAAGVEYLQCEPTQYGSMMLPVNWNGTSEELILISSDVLEGGLLDGRGRRAVRFPADGHPSLCCAALDLTGDARDEIVVWDAHEMWVYTQHDNPRPGRLYKPIENPHYNESNYKTSVSLPGWTE